MKRIVLFSGLIAGVIASAMMVVTRAMVVNGTIKYDIGTVVGYVSMVLALSMIFGGIKRYRNQLCNGSISFGEAVKVGLLITAVASVIYAVTWDVYYRMGASDFSGQYAANYLDKMQKEGASPEEISSMREQMSAFTEMYKNTFIRFGITLIEMLPVGLLITLVSAAILKRSR